MAKALYLTAAEVKAQALLAECDVAEDCEGCPVDTLCLGNYLAVASGARRWWHWRERQEHIVAMAKRR